MTIVGILNVLIGCGAVFLLVLLDRVMWHRWLTPISVTAVPYVLAWLLAAALSPSFNWISPAPEVLSLGAVAFVGMFAGAATVYIIGPAMAVSLKARPHQLIGDVSGPWIEIALIFVSASLALLAWSELSGIIGDGLKSTAAFEDVSGQGITGHLRVLLVVLVIVYLGALKKIISVHTLSVLACALTVLAIFQTKSWLLIGVVGGVVLRALRQRWSVKKMFTGAVVLTIIGAALFASTYWISAFVTNGRPPDIGEFFIFIVKHFSAYASAGIAGFSGLIRDPASQPVEVGNLFASFINVYSVLFGNGDLVTHVIDVRYPLSEDGTYTTNVFTMFGYIYGAIGLVGMLLLSFCISVWVYSLYLAAVLTRSIWVGTVYAIWVAGLVFSWFGYFYGSLFFYEASVIVVVMAALDRLLRLRLKSASVIRSSIDLNRPRCVQ